MTFPPDVPPRWSTRSGDDRARRITPRRLAIIACLVLVAILTACGSDGDDDSSTTTTTESATTRTDTDDDQQDPPDDTTAEPGPTTTVPEETTTVPDPGPEPDPDPRPRPDPDRELDAFENQYIGELTGAMADMNFPDSVDSGCVSTAWVTAIGGDHIQAAGLSAEDFVNHGPGDLGLDRATAEAMHEGSLDCGLNAGALALASGSDASEVGCLEAAVSEEMFEAAMVATYMGEFDAEVVRQLEDALVSCS